ncbi:transcription elongation factor GreA [Candidatus Uhrbacteria bacterium]|nr:transcription elongation factor GreA [Candidatus Uhrbacteria bacterium]
MQHYLTQDGYLKLKSELEHLKTFGRKEVSERIATAKELGDLKENAEYAEAKDDQGLMEAKISELEEVIKNAVIVDEEKKRGNTQTVSIGSVVSVSCNGNTCEYMIVGSEEADPSHAKISYESPLGRAFLNRRIGDRVAVTAPKGEYTYVILEIK